MCAAPFSAHRLACLIWRRRRTRTSSCSRRRSRCAHAGSRLTLWPRSVIATAALNLLGGEETAKHGRKAEIVAAAAHAILTRPSRECTGNFFIDEDVLRSEGVLNFYEYAVKQGEPLMRDLFVDEA